MPVWATVALSIGTLVLGAVLNDLLTARRDARAYRQRRLVERADRAEEHEREELARRVGQVESGVSDLWQLLAGEAVRQEKEQR